MDLEELAFLLYMEEQEKRSRNNNVNDRFSNTNCLLESERGRRRPKYN